MKTTAMTTIDRWRARGLRPDLSRQTLQAESWVDPEAAFDRAMDQAFDRMDKKRADAKAAELAQRPATGPGPDVPRA
jgi:hypothetical protein